MYKEIKIIPLFLAVVTCLSITMTAIGGDVASDEAAALKRSLEDKAEDLIYAPIGVFDIEYDEDGNGSIVRLKIKGEADVPTSMRGSRADRFAREKANRDARASFTKFLGENVVFSESEGEGILIQEKDGQESSEAMTVSARLYSSNSAAMLKGLIVLMDRIEGEGDRRVCTVVLGWSQNLVNASNTARAEMTRSNPKNQEPTNTTPAPVAETARKATGNIETVTRVGNLKNF